MTEHTPAAIRAAALRKGAEEVDRAPIPRAAMAMGGIVAEAARLAINDAAALLRRMADAVAEQDDPAAPPTPRRILTDQEYDAAHLAAEREAPRSASIAEALAAAFATVGILTPPPEPEPDTCTAMCADETGVWWQCEEQPGHDAGGDGHDGGDLWWSNDHPDAIPPRDTNQQ